MKANKRRFPVGMAVALFCLFWAAPSPSMDRVRLNACDGCSAAQEQDMVKRLAQSSGYYVFYVANARSMRKYRVNRTGNELQICEEKAEEPYLRAYDKLLQFHDTEPYGFKKYYEFQIIDPRRTAATTFRTFHADGQFVPRNIGIGGGRVYPIVNAEDASLTVYDVVRRGARQAKFLRSVRDGILSEAGIDVYRVVSALALLEPVDDGRYPVADAVIYFSDGGQITLHMERPSLDYRIVEDQARDSHRNAVPTHAGQLENIVSTFDFRGPGNVLDRKLMRSWLRELGVEFLDVPTHASHYRCGHPPGTGRHAVAACKRIEP